ncbi:TapB family protein [Hymenobacter chitinivorans]|uniref:DUF3108 domain-containing protein n=1 Tax=Hymenobacter chitinivorans DSM 11115 TaxID=1121954 RepID=A0A2M9BQS3_9BACT|nr:hypothetical protein [Hymenobacter chitinivorans]PJJ60252.1 hypothetical protein CLV45_1677 [Hymenobacter chitinivorans DSM 11115]
MSALPSLRLLGALLLTPLPLALLRAQTAPPAAPDTATTVAPAATPAPATGLDCHHPFGLSDNNERVYRLTSADGKPAGELRMRVVSLSAEMNKKKTVETHKVLLKSGLYDSKSRLLNMQDLTISCRQDTSFVDGMSEFKPESIRSFRDRKFEYAPVALAWPHQPKIGSLLPAGGSQVAVSSSVVDIAKVSSMVRKRKVVGGPAPVQTPAGTFSCYKVESEHEDATQARKDIVLRTTYKVVDYYSPTMGIVKTEVYDKKGKLSQTRTLAVVNSGQGQ